MADIKRNTAAGKVATPKTTPSTAPTASSTTPTPSTSTREGLVKAIGAGVKLTLAASSTPQTLEGTIYTVCPKSNVLMLNTRTTDPAAAAKDPVGDYHTIPLSGVQSFQILALPEGPPQPLPPVDEQRLEARLAARVQALKEEKEERPKGVSKEAQAIFDAFKRINMPVRWHGGSIIVHEAVIISPPYGVEDCRGPSDKKDAVSQVKRALEGEKRKMREREERDKKGAAGAGAGAGHRKGG
ncbi:hypothetical protein MBLNU230_g8093t1 [Neophaeotheca triangularis]